MEIKPLQEILSETISFSNTIPSWPVVGDKIKAKNPLPEFAYPFYTDAIADAQLCLVPGGLYTIEKIEVYSSWCAVWLEELKEIEGRPDRFFHYSFFERKDETN